MNCVVLEEISDFFDFGISHVQNKMSWRWDPNLNVQFVSYPSYSHNLKIALNNILNNFMHETKFHCVKFSICGGMMTLEGF
jgi:hypothetical protein